MFSVEFAKRCLLVAWALYASACAVGAPPRAAVRPALGTIEEGWASWYGARYHGRRTASGERFDMFAMTAAHRRWAFGTFVRVVHLRTGRTVVVRINDRGPYAKGRILDLSRRSASVLGMLREGRARVRLEVVPTPAGPLARQLMLKAPPKLGSVMPIRPSP